MTKRTTVAEKLVLKWTLDALHKRPDLCLVTRFNTGAIKLDGKRFVRFGAVGWSDILGVTRRGAFMACECKSSVGRLSEAQAAFKARVEEMNGLYFLVAGSGDIAEMIATLERETQRIQTNMRLTRT